MFAPGAVAIQKMKFSTFLVTNVTVEWACNIRFEPIPVKVTCANLWPHFCWGRMCDSTQVSLCPSPMQIHQSIGDSDQKTLTKRLMTPNDP